MVIHLNIGSNIGHRRSAIERAVAALHPAFPGCTVRMSAFIESPPWGFESPHPFLNVGVAIESPVDIPPLEVLDRTEAVQASISTASHRTATGEYADRLIDIDIIAIDSLVLSTPRLTLPHPRMHLRPFVLFPLAELDPGWIHPQLGLTPSALLASLNA